MCGTYTYIVNWMKLEEKGKGMGKAGGGGGIISPYVYFQLNLDYVPEKYPRYCASLSLLYAAIFIISCNGDNGEENVLLC